MELEEGEGVEEGTDRARVLGQRAVDSDDRTLIMATAERQVSEVAETWMEATMRVAIKSADERCER